MTSAGSGEADMTVCIQIGGGGIEVRCVDGGKLRSCRRLLAL